MSKVVVIDWDLNVCRGAAGTYRGSSSTIESVVEAPIPHDESSAKNVPETLAKAYSNHGLKKRDAIFLVGRSGTELRMLSVPAVPINELPDIVRFQAMRQFSAMTDDWLLDFVPLPPTPNGQLRVLAVGISPQLVEQIKATAALAGLNVIRITSRPFAFAGLLRTQKITEQTHLVIELLPNEFSIILVTNGQVELVRTVVTNSDLPKDDRDQQVIAEVKRTIGSMASQNLNREIDALTIIGDQVEFSKLSAKLSESIGKSVQILDPLDIAKQHLHLRISESPNSASLGAVIGAFGLPEGSALENIDFINPTSPPKPPSQKQKYILWGGIAAAVAIVVLGGGWFVYSQKSSELARLQKQIKEMQKNEKMNQEIIEEVKILESWQKEQVNWFEELAEISKAYPLPDDAVVENVIMDLLESEKKATIQISGKAKPDAVTLIKTKLSDSERGRTVNGQKLIFTEDKQWVKYNEKVLIDLTSDQSKPEPETGDTAKSDGTKSDASESQPGKSDAGAQETGETAGKNSDSPKGEPKGDSAKPESTPAEGEQPSPQSTTTAKR